MRCKDKVVVVVRGSSARMRFCMVTETDHALESRACVCADRELRPIENAPPRGTWLHAVDEASQRGCGSWF